ncbi:unnamed protein product, partial [Symbiodinium pilosum]
VRSTLQDMIRKSVAKIKSSIPAGAADDVAAFLADQLSAANRNAAGNSGQAPDFTAQAAFASVLENVPKKLGGPDTLRDVTLADLMFTMADVIYEHVPTAVPSLAAAVVIKFAEHDRLSPEIKETSGPPVPSYYHFLCVAENNGNEGDANESKTLKPNNDTLQTLSCVRGMYMLNALQAQICRVASDLCTCGEVASYLVAQALLKRLSKDQVWSDFTSAKMLRCLQLMQSAADASGSSGTIPTPVLAMESLLTAMVADESDWSTCWTKYLRYAMEHDKIPGSLKDVCLSVPRHLQYMLDASLANIGVKAEDDGDSAEVGETKKDAATLIPEWKPG